MTTVPAFPKLVFVMIVCLAALGISFVPTFTSHAEISCITSGELSPDGPMSFYGKISGGTVAFVDSAALSVVINLINGQKNVHGTETVPANPPQIDGDYVVWGSNFEDVPSVFIMDIASNQTHPTAIVPQNPEDSYWSPLVSNGVVLFLHEHIDNGFMIIDLVMFDPETGTLTNITNFDPSYSIFDSDLDIFEFSTDGQKVVYAAKKDLNLEEIRIYDIATQQTTTVQNATLSYGFEPIINGDFVAFTGMNTSNEIVAYLYQISTGTLTEIEAVPNSMNMHVTSFNGTHVLYYTEDVNGTDLKIYDVFTGVITPIQSNFALIKTYNYPEIKGDYAAWSQNDPAPEAFDGTNATNYINTYRYQISANSIAKLTNAEADPTLEWRFGDLDDNGNVLFDLKNTTTNERSMRYYACGESVTPAILQSPANLSIVNPTTGAVTFLWAESLYTESYSLNLYTLDGEVPLLFKSFFIDADANCNVGVCAVNLDLSAYAEAIYQWDVISYNYVSQSSASNGKFTFETRNVTPELLVNGGFEGGLSNGWATVGRAKRKCNTELKTISFNGNCALLLTSGSRATQRINSPTLDPLSDQLVFSAFARSNAAGGKLRIIVRYTDTELLPAKLNFKVGGNNFTEYTSAINPSGTVANIRAILMHRGLSGKVWVDDASLMLKLAGTLAAASGDTIPLPAPPQLAPADGFDPSFKRGN